MTARPKPWQCWQRELPHHRQLTCVAVTETDSPRSLAQTNRLVAQQDALAARGHAVLSMT